MEEDFITQPIYGRNPTSPTYYTPLRLLMLSPSSSSKVDFKELIRPLLSQITSLEKLIVYGPRFRNVCYSRLYCFNARHTTLSGYVFPNQSLIIRHSCIRQHLGSYSRTQLQVFLLSLHCGRIHFSPTVLGLGPKVDMAVTPLRRCTISHSDTASRGIVERIDVVT